MATVIKTTFKFRRGLAKDWASVNPILSEGEPGWTLDTHVLKIGDGVSPWNDLTSISNGEVSEQDIENAVYKYLEEHPVQIVTDTTLTVAGQAADAAAVRLNCLFNTDHLILKAGDADENTFA